MSGKRVDFKLEVVVIPFSDVDRAKLFYGSLGWRLDADFPVSDALRVVQFTPPGSPCSVHFGKGLTSTCRARPRETIWSCRTSWPRAPISPSAEST
jgi:hypothetical protein